MTSDAAVPAYRAAVIGSPIRHSLSPVLHSAAYNDLGLVDWTYSLWEVPRDEVGGAVSQVARPPLDGEAVWAGLSVTMPDKQALLPLLDVVDPLAATVGAVNTVVAQRSGRGRALLTGFNTDVSGIVGALREARGPGVALELSGRPALILGSGATACSALAALTEMGAQRIVVAARQHAGPHRAMIAAHRMGLDIEPVTWDSSDLAATTHVAGVAAEVARSGGAVVSTLPAHGADSLAEALRSTLGAVTVEMGAVLLDAVYEPWPTALARTWAGCGGATAPGWLMLLHQAVPQVRLMTGHEPDVDVMRQALRNALDARASGRPHVAGSAPCFDG